MANQYLWSVWKTAAGKYVAVRPGLEGPRGSTLRSFCVSEAAAHKHCLTFAEDDRARDLGRFTAIPKAPGRDRPR